MRLSNFTAVVALTAAATLLASPIVAAPAWETPPGWADTHGGDGGRVIRVTTLAAGGPGSFAAALAAEGPRAIEFAVAGNVERRGQSTTREFDVVEGLGPLDIYAADNLFFDASGKALPAKLNLRAAQGRPLGQDPRHDPRVVDTPPFWPPRMKARPASETATWVLATAGARPWDRDPVDRRLVEEAKTGGGKIIHYESEVGGHAILGR